MADIMYDYNKTRLMYGLRKLAQDQPKKEEKEQAAPAPAPAPAPAGEPTQNKPQTKPSAIASALGSAAQKKGIQVTEQNSGGLAKLVPWLGKKDTSALADKPGPNYNFTQQQWAAARKRRALITAVAGTVGFGTGYLANQLISDDPTLTGGLLTGGVVGALAGGAGYALSDPQTYLKHMADNEFKNNNPGGGKDDGKGKGKGRSWGDRVDALAAWITDHPGWAAASGLGLATLWGTAKHLGRRGIIAIPETLQRFKGLFSQNKGNDAQKPVSNIEAAKAEAQEVKEAVKKLKSENPKDKVYGQILRGKLSPENQKLVDQQLGRPSATNKQGTPAAAAPTEEPTTDTKQTTDGTKAVTPEVVPQENTPPPKNTNTEAQRVHQKQVHEVGGSSSSSSSSSSRVPVEQRVAELNAARMSASDIYKTIATEYTKAQIGDYMYKSAIKQGTPPATARYMIASWLVQTGVSPEIARKQAQAIHKANAQAPKLPGSGGKLIGARVVPGVPTPPKATGVGGSDLGSKYKGLIKSTY